MVHDREWFMTEIEWFMTEIEFYWNSGWEAALRYRILVERQHLHSGTERIVILVKSNSRFMTEIDNIRDSWQTGQYSDWMIHDRDRIDIDIDIENSKKKKVLLCTIYSIQFNSITIIQLQKNKMLCRRKIASIYPDIWNIKNFETYAIEKFFFKMSCENLQNL